MSMLRNADVERIIAGAYEGVADQDKVVLTGRKTVVDRRRDRNHFSNDPSKQNTSRK